MSEKHLSLDDLLQILDDGDQLSEWFKKNDDAFLTINQLIGEKVFRLNQLSDEVRSKLFLIQSKESYLIESISSDIIVGSRTGIMAAHLYIWEWYGFEIVQKLRMTNCQTYSLDIRQWNKEVSLPGATDMKAYIAGMLEYIKRCSKIIYKIMPTPKNPNTDYNKVLAFVLISNYNISLEVNLAMDVNYNKFEIRRARNLKG